MKPPTKASNDPTSRITAPGDMLIFINGVAPIYGVQSLYFMDETLLARTKLKPPVFRTAGLPVHDPSSPELDIASIASAALDWSSIEEHLHGNP